MNGFEKIVEMIKGAYIVTYGIENWNGLTADEKRDVVMTVAKDMCINLGYEDIACRIEA